MWEMNFSRVTIYHSLGVRELLVVLSGFISKHFKKISQNFNNSMKIEP